MKRRVMFDLFSGMKGASAAFQAAGWDVVTVDNNPVFKPSLLRDVATLDLPHGIRPDFVWASPPCTEFALRRFDKTIIPSLDLVRAAKRVIDRLEPKFYAVENVRNAVPYISEVFGEHQLVVGPYFLWGNFPQFVARPVAGKGQARGPHWLRSAIRAQVPLSLSEDMLAAVTYMLDQQEGALVPFRSAALEPASSTALEPGAGAALAPNSAAEQVPQ